MTHKKSISLLLTLVMCLSFLPVNIAFSAKDEQTRKVYLHAQQGENTDNTVNVSRVEKDTTFNLYFAIDDPNKDESGNDHRNSHYDLNGYTVKIYYDSEFLQFSKTDNTTENRPIDYTIPKQEFESPETDDYYTDDGHKAENVPTGQGYYIHKHGSGKDDVTGLSYAYITVFFSGKYLDDSKDDEGHWYNLCALPLKALKTGSTEVHIDVASSDPYTLKLYSKHTNAEDFQPTFSVTAENGGYHTIVIEDQLKPEPPKASVVSGKYTKPFEVELISDPECDIFYYDNAQQKYVKYEKPILVARTTEIKCYAEKGPEGDRIKSNIVSYEYRIVPEKPILYIDNAGIKEKIDNIHEEDKEFKVYASNEEPYNETLPADTYIYYTFSNISSDDFKKDGQNPYSEWVRLEPLEGISKLIKEDTVMRLITVKNGSEIIEISDVAKYYLGIKDNDEEILGQPLPPVFAPIAAQFITRGVVSVYCSETIGDNTDRYELLYTTDGTDPITNGKVADLKTDRVNITVEDYMIISAVVRLDGKIYSDVVTYDYEVVQNKPAAPITTLTPVYHTHKEGEGVFTGFIPTSSDDIKIYYTISENGKVAPEPDPNDTKNTKAYEKGTVFELKGETVIKAIAVNTVYGTVSDMGVFRFVITPEEPFVSYADKPSGKYEGDSLEVKLEAINNAEKIKYSTDGGETWTEYDGTPIKITEDTELLVKPENASGEGEIVTYNYELIPYAPVITLPSGRYSNTKKHYTEIQYDSRVTDEQKANYVIKYRFNTDDEDGIYIGEREIKGTSSILAYVEDINTGKKSKAVISYYIIEPAIANGDVYIDEPYDVIAGETKYISKSQLGTEEYNKGIKLLTQREDATIRYRYTYILDDGTAISANYADYAKVPILTNSSMSKLTVYAYLVDENRTEISPVYTFSYEFADLEIPVPTPDEGEVTKGESVTFKTHYAGKKEYIIYYTTNGDDPTNRKNNPSVYSEGIIIDESTTLKAVYYKACGECAECDAEKFHDCVDGIYGSVGSFRYTVPKVEYVGGVGGSSGGGGGGSGNKVVVNAKEYTKDIFGNEHPTHVSYINGYPDGSVKPDGEITREEITAILYRINSKVYDKPFSVTGEVFPDVLSTRWSVKEIEYMAENEVVLGYPDGEFKPSRNLTRAEFAALIYRFCELSETKKGNTFFDVSKEHWAYDEIQALSETGLIQGYEDESFRPEKNITRAEVMTVINKILGRNPLESYVKSLGFNPYNDLYEDKWYYVTVLEATIPHNYDLNKQKFEYKWEDWK